ncbi:hypothetical protein [Pseudoalteromonas sp.]|uniref:tail protein X n=1 Tax=Pseudoalteromonas sp. TaxID=53249 RepID=UPI002357BE4E|nr:hypothetical protein [Pseudoalteromonas sp.]
MRRTTIAHDTIDSFLNRNVGKYNDQLERDFYAINPGLESYGLFLPAELELFVPERKPVKPIKRPTAWD